MTLPPSALSTQLSPLGLPAWQYYPAVTSTNDLALAWAEAGVADFSLIVADSQTAGRGRAGRRWETQPDTSLAFSLILRPTEAEAACLPRFTALAAFGLLDALRDLGLQGTLKWPNDVLLGGKKVAGILTEAEWQADQLASLVVGMGVNVTPAAVPPAAALRYPATSVESESGAKVDRWALLASILHAIKRYREGLTAPAFIHTWNAHLAFRGQPIAFRFPDGTARSLTVIGVLTDGRLILETPLGEILRVVAGEIELAGRDNGS